MNPEIAGDGLPLNFIATGTKTGLPKPLEMMYEKGIRDGVEQYKMELLATVEGLKDTGRTRKTMTDVLVEQNLNRVIKIIKGE